MRPLPRPIQRPRHIRQQGASLIFALITLVVIGLASLALVRSVDTGSLVLGNMSFKQDATVSGDQAVRAAFEWLRSQTSATLETNNATNAAQGYYASTLDSDPDEPVDVTGQQSTAAQRQLIEWYPGDSALKDCGYTSGGNCTLLSKDAGTTPNGHNSMRYTIFRLCENAGPISGNNCASPTGLAGGNHEAGERTPRLSVEGAFYRIVVRVRGSRNSVSFIETIVQL